MENKIKLSVTYRNILSCFETDSGNIVWFYEDASFNYINHQFDKNFNSVVNESAGTESDCTSYLGVVFFKCIHLKKEIGAFAYYLAYTEVYPYISFKIFENSKINDYNSISKFQLNKVSLFYYDGLNDLLKLDDHRVCFLCISDTKKIRTETIVYVLY